MDRNYSDWVRQNFAVEGDGSLVHDTSLIMRARLQDQNQIARSQVAQPNTSGFHLPIGSEHGRFGLQGDGSLVYNLSQFVAPTNSQDQVAQVYSPSYQLPIDTGNDTPVVQQYGNVGHPPSRSVAPTLSQNQVGAQPDELPPPTLPECPVCKSTFRRVQERNRHIESYLPHSIHCPTRDCHWTGRRQSHFKEHWDRSHSKIDKAPGKELNEIYDPKVFVKLIVDGTSPVEDVARSASLKVRERLVELGKEDVGVKVWGQYFF